MALENIKNEMYTQLEILFAETAMHELTNDFEECQRCMNKIADIAEILGIPTERHIISFNLKNTPTD